MKYQHLEVSTDLLVANLWNSNIVSPENEAKIDESVERLGIFKPLVAREIPGGKLEILGGQHRWESAMRLGIEKVPVVNLGPDITDAQAKSIMLADNGRYGVDDIGALSKILRDIGSEEQIASFLPYSESEISSIFQAGDLDVDDLDIDDEELDVDEPGPSAPVKAGPTHQIMRFKVPVGDAEWVQNTVQSTITAHSLKDQDSMISAGNALVHLLRESEDGNE